MSLKHNQNPKTFKRTRQKIKIQVCLVFSDKLHKVDNLIRMTRSEVTAVFITELRRAV